MSETTTSIPPEPPETPLQAARRRLIAFVGLDTNALRAAGLDLAQPWFEKVLSACNALGAGILVPSIVFDEWFKFHKERLAQSRSKAQAALRELASFDVPERIADVVAELKDDNTRDRLVEMLEKRGIAIIPNVPSHIEQYLKEAVWKEPPFESGGKGFVDAVISDSIAAYAASTTPGSRTLLISDDAAVVRSAARFEQKGLHATIVSKENAYDAIVNSQDAETKLFYQHRDAALLKYVRESESAIVTAAREQPYSLSIFNTFKSKGFDADVPTRIVGLRPKSVDSVTVYHGIPEFIAGENRYRVSVTVKCEIDLVFKSYFDLGSIFGIGPGEAGRAPSTVGRDSPMSIPMGPMLTTPREWEETHETTMSLEGSIDRKEYDEGIASGFRLEPPLTDEQRTSLSKYHENQKKS